MEVATELARVLMEEHPFDTARVLEHLPPEQTLSTLTPLPGGIRIAVFEALDSAYAARTLLELPDDERSRLLHELHSEIAADILNNLPEEVRDNLLEDLPSLHSEEISALLAYDEDTAGSVMSPDFVALRASATIRTALNRLRRLALLGHSVNYVYVTDDTGLLEGVLLMRDLVTHPVDTPLHAIMIRNVVFARTDDPLNDVADLLEERRLLALPVVDDAGRLRGVVAATQLVSELQEEGFEDAQKMFGAGADEHASSPGGFAIRSRLPWLQVNLVTAFLAAAVVGAFENVIAQLTLLAVFLPVVASQGGNAGAQALAVMLRSLALDEVGFRQASRVLTKEAWVGLANGLASGLVAGAAAALVSGNPALGAVIAVAMTVNLVVAGVAGTAIPMIMDRLGFDPAQSSNIILTTVTDIVGFASFLGLAVLARPWLVG